MEPNEVDILIVGGGPSGLTAACELARRGIAFRIIDKALEPSAESKALGIQARTMEVFESMGIADRFEDRANKVHSVHIHADGRELACFQFGDIDSKYRSLNIVPQQETEQILIEHLAQLGGTVDRGVSLISLTDGPEFVTAQLRKGEDGPETARCKWLIGCDGAHSTVRHAIGMAFTGSAYPEDFILGDVALESSMPSDEIHIYANKRGITGLFPYAGGRCRIMATFPHGGSQVPAHGEPSLQDLRELVAERGPKGAIVSDPSWITGFKISRRIAERMRQGRVFLCGDSAHIHSPAGGQGMNTGIQDAQNLAWKLALVLQGHASIALLESYNEERRPQAEDVIRGTDILTRMMSFQNPIARALRDAVVPLAAGIDAVQDKVLAAIAEIDIDYRKSSIVTTSGTHHIGLAVAAGSRAPNAALQAMGTGALIDIHELYRTAKHTLLLFQGTEPTDGATERIRQTAETVKAEWGALIDCYVVDSATTTSVATDQALRDSSGEAHKKYGAQTDTICLVRPDGYIGFWCAPVGIEPLREYLTAHFSP